MTNLPEYRSVTQYPLKYRGNVVWPIIFLIVFFPVGFALLFLNLTVRNGDTYYGLNYHGSRGWLIFWSVIFFPVAILLGFFNGFDVVAFDTK